MPGGKQWHSTSSAPKEAPPLRLSEHSPPAQLFWQRSGLSGGLIASGSRSKADHMNPTHSANGTYTIDNADTGASRRPFLYCNASAAGALERDEFTFVRTR